VHPFTARFPLSSEPPPADPHALNQYREYLKILALQQVALRFQGKLDPSGIVQETLWEAHKELQGGCHVEAGKRLPWLRRILSNNLADAVRRMAADKRNVGREVSLQQSVEQSSMRLEAWLAREDRPERKLEREEHVLQLVAALAKLPDAQREALMLHYWTGWTLAQIAAHLGRSREAVAGLLKRGLRQLRIEMDVGNPSHDG